MKLTLNGKATEVNAHPAARLLDVLREECGLTGTKEGCGEGECGACSVLIDGEVVCSCLVPFAQAENADVITIEGLNGTHPLQKAWMELDVPQCGYCQAGQLMSAAALLASKSKPTDGDIDSAMTGNVCRCGTYVRIREAIHLAANGRRKA